MNKWPFPTEVPEHEPLDKLPFNPENEEDAVLAEREACAKVCEEPGWNAANWCAKAIRARGQA